jgi:murein DD-endopeptidase MepM/ murein hydrolase activator NlpD
MTVYFSKGVSGQRRLLDPTELARPADDKLSAPFTWRYHVGNGAYQSHRGQALTRKSRPIPGK